MRGAPAKTDADDRQGFQVGLNLSRHETPAGESVDTDQVDAEPRSPAPRQYLSAPLHNGAAPIGASVDHGDAFLTVAVHNGAAPVGASVDQTASVRQKSGVAFGDGRQIAAGCCQTLGDALALAPRLVPPTWCSMYQCGTPFDRQSLGTSFERSCCAALSGH